MKSVNGWTVAILYAITTGKNNGGPNKLQDPECPCQARRGAAPEFELVVGVARGIVHARNHEAESVQR